MTYSPLDLSGKVAVVIGGTSGIGRAIAHGLAQAGADVVPTSRRTEQVEAAAAEIEALGRRSLRVTSDVADRSSLQHVLEEAVKAFANQFRRTGVGRSLNACGLRPARWNDRIAYSHRLQRRHT